MAKKVNNLYGNICRTIVTESGKFRQNQAAGNENRAIPAYKGIVPEGIRW